MDQFVRAINNRQTLAFVYDDKERIVEPHAVGLTAKGKPVMRAFMTNNEPGWRLFSLDKISALAPPGPTFAEPRPGYNRGDKQIADLKAQL